MKASARTVGHHSRYRVVLVLFSLVIVLSIIIASIAMFSMREAQQLRSEQHEYQQSALHQAAISTDTRFGLATSLMRQFWNNGSMDVLPYLVGEDHSPYRIFRIMRALRVNQEYVTNTGVRLSIIDPVKGRLLSPAQNTTLVQMLGEMGYDPAIASDILSLAEREHIKESRYYTNERGSLLIFKAWSNATPGHVLIECYSFDMHTLAVDMAGLAECGFFILHRDQQVMSSAGDGAPTLEDLRALNAEITFDRAGQYEAGGFQIDVLRSLYFDLYFVSVSPKLSPPPWYSFSNYPAAIPIALIALGLVIAYFAASMMYRPVRKVYSHVRTLGPEPPDGKGYVNEFEAIESALHGMQSTIQNLRSIVTANQPSLKEKSLRDLMQGMIAAEDIPALAADLDLPIVDGTMSLTMVEIRNHPDLTISLLAELNPQMEQVVRAYSEQYQADCLLPIVQTISLRRFCILSGVSDLSRLESLATQITRDLEQSIGYETTSAIAIARTPETIPDAYDRVFMMIRSAHHRGLSVHTEADDRPSKVKLVYPVETERELIRAATDGGAEAVQKLLARIFTQNIEAGVFPQRLGAALLTTTERILQMTDLGDTHYEQLKQIYDDTPDMRRLEETVQALYAEITSSIKASSTDSSTSFSREILRYIDEHYMQDLSLVQVADHFRFSAVYMSTLFKNVTGTNFKDYLTQVRVTHAKELLLQGRRVHEVAELVGCNTADTFIRMFKRVEGVSPGRYQQMHMGKQDAEP